MVFELVFVATGVECCLVYVLLCVEVVLVGGYIAESFVDRYGDLF